MALGKKFEINVMMFGGRRSGKTSILAAMKECVDHAFRNEQELGLSISSPDFDTMKALEDKALELRQYYDSVKKNKPFCPDDNPTMSEQTYQFSIQLINKPGSKLQINFTDYPGEWLDNGEKFQQLTGIMEKADIIMIAIDTPYLMEDAQTEDAIGKYNEQKNYSSRIADMVKEHFLVEEGSYRKKMILFVPLKCEKYYNLRDLTKDQMERLNLKVKKAYEKLITFISMGENKEKYECAITPIFTLGNVRFTRFNTDENHEYIMNASRYPAEPLYRFDENVFEPAPEYCEQPLLYTLVFLMKWAEQVKKNRSMWDVLSDALVGLFLKFPAAADFAERSESLRSKLKKEENGYEIISDPLKFKGV